MGVSIQIKKDKECNGMGYYIVSTQDYGGAHFYIGINKSLKKMFLYASKDCGELIGEIDYTKDAPLNIVPHISVSIIGIVAYKVMKILDQQHFPDFLSHEA